MHCQRVVCVMKSQRTHRRVLDLLNGRRHVHPDLLIHQTVLRLSSHDVLSGRTSAVATGEKRLPRACSQAGASASEQTIEREARQTLVEVFVTTLRRECPPRGLGQAC